MRFHKPKLIPLIMSVSAVILLFGLGFWQLQRLEWKEEIIEKLEMAASISHTPQSLPKSDGELMAMRFHRVHLSGEFMPDLELHLAARYFRSKLGYSVFNPYKLEDGRIVMVNRGWIPAAQKDNPDRPAAPTEPISIAALVRTSNERNYFTPMNQQEKNVWFGRDTAEMGAHLELDVLPITLDVIGVQNPAVLPVPSNGIITLRNDHLGYAITWFGVGFAVLIVSLLYHRKKPDEA